jgi:hypothetical protein
MIVFSHFVFCNWFRHHAKIRLKVNLAKLNLWGKNGMSKSTFVQHLKFSIGFCILYGCHTDNGGILVLFDKLSGKDVSFVDMSAWEEVSRCAV